MGVARFGFGEKEVWKMRFGKWLDLFETYKIIYNFEKNPTMIYNTPPQEKKVTPLSDL